MMKKSTKGALAAGAAAVVLLGGAGSLAYWTSSGTIPGGAIRSGELKLTGPAATPTWTYVNLSGTVGATYTPGTSLLVPGDRIQETVTYTIAAKGDHLSATLATPTSLANVNGGTFTDDGTAAGAASTLDAPITTAYYLGATGDATDPALSSPVTITSTDNGKKVTAVITVAFPWGDATTQNANDTQKLSATLADIALTLTQTETANVNDNS